MLSLPEKFLNRVQNELGPEYPDFLSALNEKPPVSLRRNPFKPAEIFPEASPLPWCPGAMFLPERPRFVMDPLIHAGAYYVQEASSMLVYQGMNFQPGMRVLDLCASPGGKSTLLASFMSEDSLLVSNEVVGARAVVLRDNLSRWGISNTVVTCNRPEDFSSLHEFFDVIVLDAPCSGEGMFRKDPDVIAHWSPKAVEHCAERQRNILEQAIPCLKPGGRLLYSTCTYNETENEAVIDWLLSEYPDSFRILPLQVPAEWGTRPGKTEAYSDEMAGTLHCWPHLFKGEGFFLAVLEKTAETPGFRSKSGKGTKFIPAKKKPAEWLNAGTPFSFFEFKEEIAALPPATAAVIRDLGANLSILKAGITVGKWAGDKFIPDHDLALSLHLADSVPRYELSLEDAIRYLRREEIRIDTGGETGWAIVTYRGLGLGWIKRLGNRINIHLPKELRIRAEF